MDDRPTLPPGAIAPRDGGAARQGEGRGVGRSPHAIGAADASSAGGGFGANNEQLEERKPKIVAALRDLVLQFRQEGLVARRHEIRRIRQARLFWQGLQYAWWNPQDMTWHLPYESKLYDDSAAAEIPRYQFVT